MIAQLSGTVVRCQGGVIVLDVNGVGYKISVLHTCIADVGTRLILHTYLSVRETALDLYGFLSLDELSVFELLIQLPKIGPKSALQILNQADPSTLRKAVSENNAGYLSKVSGMSKKTAEKVVSGLQEKLEVSKEELSSGSVSQNNDVIDALIALGYSGRDAQTALKKVGQEEDTHTQIREALRILSSS